MYDEVTKLKFTILGIYFGYPECCIDWFCERESLLLTFEQQVVNRGYGFIPCPQCAAKVFYHFNTRETLTTRVLIKDRINSSPFPKEDNLWHEKTKKALHLWRSDSVPSMTKF